MIYTSSKHVVSIVMLVFGVGVPFLSCQQRKKWHKWSPEIHQRLGPKMAHAPEMIQRMTHLGYS